MTVAEQLDPYQSEAVDFILGREAAALFYEQGTGKTWVTAGVIERLATGGYAHVLLVVPLANVETTWAKLISTLPVEVHREWKAYTHATRARPAGTHVLLVHYEKLPGFIRKARAHRWNLVAYDESQRLKARGSKASRTAARFVDVEHRLILSGTPIEQTPIDLYAQFRFLDKNLLGTWGEFDEAWLTRTGYMGYKRKMRKALIPKFLTVVAPYIRRVTKAEVLDLPELRLRHVPVEMFGRQAALYDEMERESVAVIGDKTVAAELKITQLVRLHQIANGFLTTDYEVKTIQRGSRRGQKRRGDPITEDVGQAKARVIRRLIAKHVPTGPVVVFCRYRHEIRALSRACAQWRCAQFHGRVKRDQRAGIIEAFQRGEYDVFICQVRTGGVGIDLFRASTAIVSSTTFSFIDFDQALSRLHRRGQTRRVTIYLVYCQKTVDEDIIDAVQQKQKVTETCFRAILNRRTAMGKNKDKSKNATPAAKPADAPKTEAAPAKPAEPTFKYGVKDLAEKLGTKPASVRVRLRNHGVPKAGKSYGWNTKDELNAVVAKLNEKTAKSKDDEDGDDEGEDDEDE